MRLLAEDRSYLQVKKETEKSEFELDDPNLFIGMYRDTIYKNKLRVIPQEYMANARDAHREAGIPDKPIEVTLPTVLDPILTIRDFGIGIDEDRKEIFRRYGKSTKRGDDVANGGFGIGCKCAWSYTEQFTVDTVYLKEGKKINRVYSLYIVNKMDPGNIRIVSECEVSDDTPTGTKIQIPIMESDIDDVCKSVLTTGAFWDPQPILVNDRKWSVFPKPEVRRSGTKWQMQSNHKLFGVGSRSFAVVDGVCYALDLDLLVRGRAQYEETADGQDMEEKRYCIEKNHKKILSGNSIALFFDVNEVEVAPDRENLDYNVHTIAALRDRIQIAADEFIKGIEDEVLKDDADYYSILESIHAINIDVELIWKDIDVVKAAKLVSDAVCHRASLNGHKVDTDKATRFSFKDTNRDKTAFVYYGSSSSATNALNRLIEYPEAFEILGYDDVVLFYKGPYASDISQYVRPFLTHDKIKASNTTKRPKLSGVYDRYDRGVLDPNQIKSNALFVTKRYTECFVYYFGNHPNGKSSKSVKLSDLSMLFPNHTIYSITATAERSLKKAGIKIEFVDKFLAPMVRAEIKKRPEMRYYGMRSVPYQITNLISTHKKELEKAYSNNYSGQLALRCLERFDKHSGKITNFHCFLHRMAEYFDIDYVKITDVHVNRCQRIIKRLSPYYSAIRNVPKSVAKNIILSYKEHYRVEPEEDD